MKVRLHTKLGELHSWGLVSHALSRVMEAFGHSVYMKSSDGLEHFPDDLEHMLLPGYHNHPAMPGDLVFLEKNRNKIILDRKQRFPEDIPDINRPYDLELAYTIPLQWCRRFFAETPCKMAIWNFESSIMPKGWAMYHRAIDYILPSSKYSYDIFLNNGMPASKMVIVPHGVDQKIFNPEITPFKLHTQKKIKFLHNAIPHTRKCHDRVIEAYLQAFTGNDDVCLVLKTKFKQPDPKLTFEVDVRKILEEKLKGCSNPPEIEVVNSFVPNIGALYTACDAVVSMSACEGFHCPSLEALACGRIIIAPRHGGQLDFLNDDNSLLINTGEMKAPLNMQYYAQEKDAVVGDPSIIHCSELMRKVYENPVWEKERIANAAKKTVEKFTWEAATKQILDLAENCNAKKSSIVSNQKQHISYIIPYNMVGGGEVWIKETIKHLDRKKYEPSVIFPLGASQELLSLFENFNIKLEDLKCQGTWLALNSFIEAEKPDIVHFYNSLQVYGVLLETIKQGCWKGKLVETVHSELMWPDSMMKVSTRHNVSMIIGVSETICNKLMRMGNKNVKHLPQQIDWDRFSLPKNKNIFEEIGLPTNRFTVGTVARLSPEKNIPIVLSCARNMPDCLFVIIGDGPQENILRKMAFGLKNVCFLGHRKDVERFYAAFNVLLLPSQMEGLPLTVLEASAAGLPTVVSDVGAVREIVADGISGFVVSGGVQNYVTALTDLKNTEKAAIMGQNAFNLSKILKMRGDAININTLYNMLG